MNRQKLHDLYLFALGIWAAMVVSLIVAACTITPKAVESRHASIGLSGQPDSGTLGKTPQRGTVAQGYTIDAHALERFNALVERYGDDPIFQPALRVNEGVVSDENGITISRESYRRFALMNEWRRMGKEPVKKTILQKINNLLP